MGTASPHDTAIGPPFLAELRRRMVAGGARRIILFGSHARGEADDLSDVDIVVIQDTPLPFFERMRRLGGLLDPSWNVDLLVYTPEELERMRREGNAFVELLDEEGVVLHG
jgi:predicted nucleotidyltransferase